MAAGVTNPLDVAKTALNLQSEARLGKEEARLRGMWHALTRIYELHGAHGYFRGIQARILHQAPATAICWSVYELFKNVLGLGNVEKVDLSVKAA